MTLTICALGKNAEDYLQRFFTCLEGVADQVIVGDMGSTDKTIEICKQHGAQVVTLTNTTDFSDMRNKLLASATSEWILALDCHETLSNPELRRLSSFLEQTEHDVFIIPICNYTNERNLMGWRPSQLSNYEGYVPAKHARLFRNNSAISFHYPVNETILPSVEGKSFDVKEITDISIHNHNYTDQIESFYTILKKLHEKKPDDLHIMYDLALVYLRKGRLRSSKELFAQIVKKNQRYKNALTNLATIYLKMDDHVNAAKIYLQALEVNPKDLNAYHNLGQLFWQNKNYEKSEYLFKKALSIEPREPRLIIALSKVYRGQGKADEAKQLLERSLTLLPKNKLIEEALAKL